MTEYKIYESATGLREAVKQGWSWPGCLFTFIWAFIKKMNTIGGALLGGWLALGFIVGASGGNEDAFGGISFLLELVVMGVFGANGNAWREKNLMTRGYVFKGQVAAQSDEAALTLSHKQVSAAQLNPYPVHANPVTQHHPGIVIPPPPPPKPVLTDDPTYRIASNGVDLGEMQIPAIREKLQDGVLKGEDYYFDVTARAWLPIKSLKLLDNGPTA